MKIKLLLLSLVAVAAMSLSACSNTDSSSDVSIPDSSNAESITTTTTTITTTTTAKPEETPTETTTTTEASQSEQTSVTTTTTTSETTTTTTTTAEETKKTTTTTTKKPTTTTKVTTTKKPTTTTTTTTQIKADPIYEEYGHDGVAIEKFKTRIDKNTQIPVINISTKDSKQIVSLDNYVDCIIDVFSCDEEFKMSATKAGVRVRGKSSAYYGDVAQILKNQVPYRIKFEKKQNMLGLNDGAKCKSWVLLKSNWNLIADYLGFTLGDLIVGETNFCSDCTFVHVYVNKAFKGVYLLCEQTQVNENRVDVTEPEADYKGTDIGYLVEIDNYAEEPFFDVNYAGATMTDIQGTTRKFEPAQYSIKSDIYSDAQKQFISKYVNGVFEIMYEACENENYLTFDENYNLVKAPYTNAKDTIAAVADIDSIVNSYILEEICCDNDCGEGSFFMCVDFSKDSKYQKLTFTAPWDYNWGYEDRVKGKYHAAAFNQSSFVNQFGDRTNPWFVLLMTEDWFQDLVKARWNEVYTSKGLIGLTKDAKALCETYFDDLSKKQEYAPYSGMDLADWVLERMKWLDKQWG